MKFKVKQEVEIMLEFYDIGNSDYSDVIAATNLYEALKTAAAPGYGNDFTNYIKDNGEDLIINKIPYSEIENIKVTDYNTNKLISIKYIMKSELKAGNLNFIIFSKGDL